MSTLTGTPGDDVWYGLIPTASVDAQAGNDSATWLSGVGPGSGALMGAGLDTVQISGIDGVHNMGGVFAGGDDSDSLRNDSDDSVTLEGDAGNDHLYGSARSLGDRLIGEPVTTSTRSRAWAARSSRPTGRPAATTPFRSTPRP